MKPMTNANLAYLKEQAKTLPPLGPWGEEAKLHWQRHRPLETAELVAAGVLDAALQVSEQMAKETYEALLKQKVNPHEAERRAKKDHLLLEAEEASETSETSETI
jgi:hypothetical protein